MEMHQLTEGGRCNDLTSSISLLSLVAGSSTSSTKLMKEKLYLPNTCILNMRVRTSLACPCAPRSFCDHITVESRLTTTPFIRPPRYYGHILSNQK